VELTVDAPTDGDARSTVERLARELFSNPLIESFEIERIDVAVEAGR
jgi:phosphoribosylformylglycinamidine (FGAM) synthase PurS component